MQCVAVLNLASTIDAENNVRRRIDRRVQEAANEAIADSSVALSGPSNARSRWELSLLAGSGYPELPTKALVAVSVGR